MYSYRYMYIYYILDYRERLQRTHKGWTVDTVYPISHLSLLDDILLDHSTHSSVE